MAKRRSRRKTFAPVAREVRKAFRNAELEASKLLSEFLGYPVEVRRKRETKPTTKPGDLIGYRAAKRSIEGGYYKDRKAALRDMQAPLTPVEPKAAPPVNRAVAVLRASLSGVDFPISD